MKLFLKNIGKIEHASVEIEGITVIAGENNTGKSTVGRTLFSVFNSFYNIEEQILKEKSQSIEHMLSMLYRNVTKRLISRVVFEEIADSLVVNQKKYIDNQDMLKDDLLKFIVQYDENFYKFEYSEKIEEVVKRMLDVFLVSDEEIFKLVLDKNFEAEFYGQINNIYTENMGEVGLQIKDEMITVQFVNDEVSFVAKKIELQTEVIYFDDPFILDEQRIFATHRNHLNYVDHKTHLKSKLFAPERKSNVIEEIVVNNKFEKIYEKINEICDGKIIRGRNGGWGYKEDTFEKALDVRNVSTGLKTFIILKKLLGNGIIEYNGTIILDEPEIHLHPEWQLVFAELIVLLQKEFGIHILLNTHSPYFLNAIEVYAAKYEISSKCRFYIAEMNGKSAFIEDVTDNIERIYSRLARPLQDLENERYENE